MNLGIQGRRAIICGASKGLGFACALALAEEGAETIIVSRSAETLEAAAVRIEKATGRICIPIAADLSTIEGRAKVLKACAAPDVLVTNGGGPPSKDFTELSLEDWRRALETNFLSAVELMRSLVPGMVSRNFGRVINVTSLTVRMPVERLDLSTATRLALTGYVAGVSRQVARHGVTINNLLPGTIATERIRDLGDTARALIDKVPAGRAGEPAEFGAACAFLSSMQAAFITGQNLLVDGGLCPITV